MATRKARLTLKELAKIANSLGDEVVVNDREVSNALTPETIYVTDAGDHSYRRVYSRPTTMIYNSRYNIYEYPVAGKDKQEHLNEFETFVKVMVMD